MRFKVVGPSSAVEQAAPNADAFMRDYLAVCKMHGLFFNTGPMGDEPTVERFKGSVGQLIEDGDSIVQVMDGVDA